MSPANGEQVHLVNYVEDYLDSIESLPFDLQRSVSLMREIDAKYQGTAGGMGGGGRSIPAGRGAPPGRGAVLFPARRSRGPAAWPGRNKRSGASLIRQGPCARSPDTEEEGGTGGLHARLREQSALCSEVTRRGTAGEGAQGAQARAPGEGCAAVAGAEGRSDGAARRAAGRALRAAGPRLCSPSPEPPPPSPESECYIKSGVGTPRRAARVAAAPPTPAPGLPWSWTASEGRRGRV